MLAGPDSDDVLGYLGDRRYAPGTRRRYAYCPVFPSPAIPGWNAALARQGRYQQVSENLRVKEVNIAEHERFVVGHNPDAADRDAATRARLVAGWRR